MGFVSLMTRILFGFYIVKYLVPHVASVWDVSRWPASLWVQEFERLNQVLLMATLLDAIITVVICNCKTFMVLKTIDATQLQKKNNLVS